MRDFIRILKRFVPPYKKYMVLNIVFNVEPVFFRLDYPDPSDLV